MPAGGFRTVAAALGAALLATAPAEAAQNGRIAFTSFRDGGEGQIYTMAPDGSDQRRITFDPRADAQADWAPDGSAIAFRRGVSGGGGYEVWRMGPAGESPRALTDSPAGESSSQPAWLPDGSGFVYRRSRSGESEIWRMGTDGGAPARVTAFAGHEWYPSMSPAGSRLLLSLTIGAAADGDRGIFSTAPDGSDRRTLRDLPGVYDSAPAWSPDGSRVAFESDADGDMEVYVMDAGGGNVRQLTFNAEHDEGPTWSPDGTRIAFVRGVNDLSTDVYTMAADGTDVRRLTTTAARDESPDWQPVPDPPAPGGGTTTPPPPPPAPRLTPQRPSLSLAGRRPTLRRALRYGIRLRVFLPGRATASLAAVLPRATARRLGVARRVAARRPVLPAGTTVVRLRFRRAARPELRTARRLPLRLRLAAPGGTDALTLTLRR